MNNDNKLRMGFSRSELVTIFGLLGGEVGRRRDLGSIQDMRASAIADDIRQLTSLQDRIAMTLANARAANIEPAKDATPMGQTA